MNELIELIELQLENSDYDAWGENYPNDYEDSDEELDDLEE